ncbi:MAG: fructosamine kinase family protein [Lewinellaceae bacterium]|nr:fructosamine kinase family protein [Lewinellaceae bacterium]
MSLSPTLLTHLETRFQVVPTDIRPVRGGDIHQAFRLTGAGGRQWFVKTNTDAQASDMFRTEAQGLALLGASQCIRTPKIYGYGCTDDGHAYLLLEYVPPGYRNRLFWEQFGRGLANLHGNTSAVFGFAHDTFIGRLPQSNTRHDTWAAFYAEERLWPQMLLAREQGYFDSAAEQQLDRLCHNLAWRCPAEPPALTHGDLWSGNFLCDTDGLPVLIDPAAAFAHREMDLAMSRLFGGFDPAFYAAYSEAWPLENGFEQRVDIYQLYYLLVHVNLFGGGYADRVRGILEHFG